MCDGADYSTVLDNGEGERARRGFLRGCLMGWKLVDGAVLFLGAVSDCEAWSGTEGGISEYCKGNS